MASVIIAAWDPTPRNGFLPTKTWSKMVDTSDEWIRTRSGIRQRHIAADDEATSDLAIKAASAALLDANIKAEEIDLFDRGDLHARLPHAGHCLCRSTQARRTAPCDLL